jgi:hypothetical protein
MVSGITEKPRTETVNFFNKLLEGFHEGDNGNPGRTQLQITGTSQNADTIGLTYLTVDEVYRFVTKVYYYNYHNFGHYP